MLKGASVGFMAANAVVSTGYPWGSERHILENEPQILEGLFLGVYAVIVPGRSGVPAPGP